MPRYLIIPDPGCIMHLAMMPSCMRDCGHDMMDEAMTTMESRMDSLNLSHGILASKQALLRFNSWQALDDFRSKYRYRRTLDGRVQLKSSKGDWWSVRLDMEVSSIPLRLTDPVASATRMVSVHRRPT